MVRVTENKPEPTKQEKGLFSYLWDKVDIIIKASNEVLKKKYYTLGKRHVGSRHCTDTSTSESCRFYTAVVLRILYVSHPCS